MKYPIRSLVSAAVVAVIATQAQAGSFSLYTEGAGYASGNYAAGAAAEARDASTGWYNPAGLALLKNKQVVLGGVGVFPRSDVTGTTRYSTIINPNLPPISYTQTVQDLQGADSGFVPSFHLAYPLEDNRTTLGLSVVAPFGLATDWGTASPVRYAATYTDLMTVDVSPEIGYKLTEDFLVGAGVDIEYAKVKFNRMLGSPALLGFLGQNQFFYDSLSYNKGDSWGVGFHAGIMKLFNDNHTRIGLNYQSQVRQKFNGWSELRGPLATEGANIFAFDTNPSATFKNNSLTSNPIDLPDLATLSIYQDINDKLAILGSVIYTGWGSIDTIQLNGVAVPAISQAGVITHSTASSSSELNYRNAWRASLGLNYTVNDKLMVRVGGGFDQTPTVDAYRDLRVPDVNRWALAVGAHYQVRSDIGVDVGYTHLFAADDILVNKTEAIGTTSSYNVNVTGSGCANLVGAQLVWTIDNPMPMPTK